jgi:hypothetical protein
MMNLIASISFVVVAAIVSCEAFQVPQVSVKVLRRSSPLVVFPSSQLVET